MIFSRTFLCFTILLLSLSFSPLSAKALDSLRSGIKGKVEHLECRSRHEGRSVRCKMRPFQTTVIVKSQDGTQEITRVTTNTNGKFKVPLPPATYQLETLSGDTTTSSAISRNVWVVEKNYTKLTINFPNTTQIRL
jgi:hypothetical protein